MKTIKLVIADDHELFRNGLKELLKKYDDVDVVNLVEDGEEFM
jgi:DNA-binding NarL/FixJ family response regulator